MIEIVIVVVVVVVLSLLVLLAYHDDLRTLEGVTSQYAPTLLSGEWRASSSVLEPMNICISLYKTYCITKICF